ncbi:MAG: hypothetical protein QN120_10240 [Armatimonadota bacterium]|nr:hypothetical protein [Armatimonadota bacterium]
MRDWLRRLVARGAGGADEDAAALWLEVRCTRCGEVLRVRVDTRYELWQDVEDGVEVHVLDKDLLGTKCFALLHVHAVLAPDFSVRSHQVTGGEFLSLSRARTR